MPVSVYIHVPFCLKKCAYCSFISYPYDPAGAGLYIRALKTEMSLWEEELSREEREVGTLYIGGGTPTCLRAGELASIVEEVSRRFLPLPGWEVTAEANPGTVDAVYLKTLRRAGVNRLSLGVQSFDDRLLEILGRTHSARCARQALYWAREAGFDNVSIDLIYGIPGQTNSAWRGTLKEAVGHGPEHLSVYGLELEEGTELAGRIKRGEVEAPGEDAWVLMYRTAVFILKSAGYEHYEISNFARPLKYARHNVNCWRCLPYLGLGPAAHSYLRGRRFSNYPELGKYAALLAGGELPVEHGEEITPEKEMAEALFLGLRLLRGIDLADFERRFGQKAEEAYGQPLGRLREAGLVKIEGGRLFLTKRGILLSNAVFRELVEGRS